MEKDWKYIKPKAFVPPALRKRYSERSDLTMSEISESDVKNFKD